MARRHDDEPTPKNKGSQSEPNLELPSFRLGRRKKVSQPETGAAGDVPVAKRPPTPPAPPRAATPQPPIHPSPREPRRERVAPKRRPPAPPQPDEVLVPKQVPKPPVSVKESIPRGVRGSSLTEAPSPTPPKRPKPAKRAEKPKEPRPPKASRKPRVRRTTPRVWLPGWLAAILTGAGCGALTVVLAWGTAQGCDAVRGVGTCGNFGIVALVAILGIDVVVATGLLRLFRVGDPATTSLLGVGLVAVAAMLFFLKNTESHAMVYVIPILMAVTFAMSWWVTQAIAPGHDD